MIKLKISLAGTDAKGNTFSCAPGECVELDEKSEANYIREGMAEDATKKAVKKSVRK